MLILGVLKRVIPFVLALAAGLVIAGIFIPISAPRFDFSRGTDNWSSREIRRLRRENRELRRHCPHRHSDLRRSPAWDGTDLNSAVPPVVVDVPPPPPPPPPRIR